MYSLKKMTQKISKTYTLSFPKAAHSLEAQDQGVKGKIPGGVPGEVSLLSTGVSSWIPMGNRDTTAGRCQGGTWRSTC